MRKYDTIAKLLSLLLIDNHLTPVSFAETTKMPCGDSYYKLNCICVCGKYVEISLYHFVNNKIRSCGCLKGKMISNKVTKYPGNVKSIRSSYDCMISRCYDINNEAYKYYGGSGVTVCDEWINDYNSFLKWAKENGWEQGLCIDKDKIGTGKLYSPANCVWITHAENMKYTRRAIIFEYQGEIRTLNEIGKMVGVRGEALKLRIEKGMSLKQAISKPKYKHSKSYL